MLGRQGFGEIAGQEARLVPGSWTVLFQGNNRMNAVQLGGIRQSTSLSLGDTGMFTNAESSWNDAQCDSSLGEGYFQTPASKPFKTFGIIHHINSLIPYALIAVPLQIIICSA